MTFTNTNGHPGSVLHSLQCPPQATSYARIFRQSSGDIYRRVCLWLLIVMGVVVIVL